MVKAMKTYRRPPTSEPDSGAPALLYFSSRLPFLPVNILRAKDAANSALKVKFCVIFLSD